MTCWVNKSWAIRSQLLQLMLKKLLDHLKDGLTWFPFPENQISYQMVKPNITMGITWQISFGVLIILKKCSIVINSNLKWTFNSAQKLTLRIRDRMDRNWPVWMTWRWWWCWYSQWWLGCQGRCCSRSHLCSSMPRSWCSLDVPFCRRCFPALMKPLELACHRET